MEVRVSESMLEALQKAHEEIEKLKNLGAQQFEIAKQNINVGNDFAAGVAQGVGDITRGLAFVADKLGAEETAKDWDEWGRDLTTSNTKYLTGGTADYSFASELGRGLTQLIPTLAVGGAAGLLTRGLAFSSGSQLISRTASLALRATKGLTEATAMAIPDTLALAGQLASDSEQAYLDETGKLKITNNSNVEDNLGMAALLSTVPVAAIGGTAKVIGATSNKLANIKLKRDLEKIGYGEILGDIAKPINEKNEKVLIKNEIDKINQDLAKYENKTDEEIQKEIENEVKNEYIKKKQTEQTKEQEQTVKQEQSEQPEQPEILKTKKTEEPAGGTEEPAGATEKTTSTTKEEFTQEELKEIKQETEKRFAEIQKLRESPKNIEAEAVRRVKNKKTEDDFIKVNDDVEDITKIDQIGAFINEKTNKFVINTPRLGKIVGDVVYDTINGKTRYIVDVKKSSFNEISLKYKGSRIIEPFKPVDTSAGSKVETPKDAQFFTTYKNSEEVNHGVLNDEIKSEKETIIRNLEEKNYENENEKIHYKDKTNENITKREQTLVAKFFTHIANNIQEFVNIAKKSKSSYHRALAHLKIIQHSINEYIKENKTSIIDGVATKVAEDFKNAIKNETFDEDLNDVINTITHTEGIKNQGLETNEKKIERTKEEFIEILKENTKLATFEYVNKYGNTEEIPESNLENIISKIIDNTFEAIGIRGEGLKFEQFKIKLKDKLKGSLTNTSGNPLFVTKNLPENAIENIDKIEVGKPKGNTYQINEQLKNEVKNIKEKIETIYNDKKPLHETEYTNILRNINDKLKFKNSGIHINDTSNARIRNDFEGVTSEAILEFAKSFAKAKFEVKIDKEDVKKLKEIRNKIIGYIRNEDYNELQKFLDIPKYTVTNKSEQKIINDTIQDTVEQYLREIDTLLDLAESPPAGSTISFDVLITSNNRVMFDSIINPQNSKIARFFIRPVNTKPLTTRAEKELYKRYIIDKYGEKNIAFTLKTEKEVNEKFENIYNNLNKKEIRTPEEELDFLNIEKFKKTEEEAEEKQIADYPIDIIVGVDGKNNMYALISSLLKKVNSGVGVGSLINSNEVLYEKLMTKLTGKLGLGFNVSKKVAKSIIMPDLYGSSIFGEIERAAEIFIMEEPENAYILLKKYLSVAYPSVDMQNKIEEINTSFKRFNELRKEVIAKKSGKDFTGADEALEEMKDIKNQIEKLRALDKNNTDIIDLISAKQKLEKKLENGLYEALTDKEIAEAKKAIVKVLKDPVEESLNEIIDQEVKDFFNDVEKITLLAKIYFHKALNTEVENSDKIKTVIEEASNKYGFKIKNMHNFNKLQVKPKEIYKELVERLISENIIDVEDITKLPFVQDKIPYIINSFGDKVPIAAIKAVGYDKKTGLRFETIANGNIMFPIYIQSHDAGIAARAIDANRFVSAFDAVYGGGGIIEIVREMNKYIGLLFRDSNVYSNLLDFFDKKILNDITEEDIDKYLDDVAKETAIRKNKIREGEDFKKAINEEKEKLRKILLHGYDDNNIEGFKSFFKDRLLKKQQEINKRIEDFSKNVDKENFVIDQFSLGSEATRVKAKDFGKEKLETKKIENKNIFIAGNFDKSYLKTIVEKAIEKAYRIFSTFSKETDSIEVPDKIKVVIDKNAEKSYYSEEGNIIVLNKDTITPQLYLEIIHEFMHKAVKSLSKKDEKGLFQYLREKLPKVIEIKDEAGNVIKKVTDPEEIITMHLSKLYFNESLFTKRDLLAYIFNKDKVGKIVDLAELFDNSIVEEMRKHFNLDEFSEIATTKDLYNFLSRNHEEKTNELLRNQLGNLIRETEALINSNEVIGALLRGKELPKIAYNVEDRQLWNKIFNAIIPEKIKLNNKINEVETIGIFEMFMLDRQKEALLKTLAIKQGAENLTINMVSNFYEKIRNDLNSLAGSDLEKFDKTLGNAILLGINILYEKGYREIFERNVGNINKLKEDLAKEISNLIEDLQHIKNAEEAYIVESKFLDKNYPKVFNNNFLKGIDEIADKLANGKYKGLIKMSEKINKEIKKIESIYRDKVDIDLQQKISDIIMLKASLKRIEKNEDSVNSVLKLINKHKDKFSSYMELFNKYKNKNTLFGENIELNAYNNGNKLVLVKSEDVKNKNDKHIVGYTEIDGEQYYVIVKEYINQVIGKQESEIIDFDATNFEKGVYTATLGKGKDKIKVYLNAQKMRTATEFTDHSFSKQITRNFYVYHKREFIIQHLFKQYQILMDSGILLTNKEYGMLSPEAKQEFVKLSAKNPITKMYGQLYYNKKFMHHFEGSKGFNSYKMFKELTNSEDLAIALTKGLKLLVDAIKILKNTVLLTRVSSYINSFVSSTVLAWIHGTSMEDFRNAKKLVKEFRELLSKEANLYLEGNVEEAIKFHNEVVAKHEIYTAFNHGLSSTIRTDAYNLGLFDVNEVHKFLRKITKDNRAADALKALTLDSSTKYGKYFGELFDNTEMIPKVALYLSEKKKHGDAELAAQYVLLAFPTYENLPTLLNAVDQFVPFTKFWYNVPKMLMFAAATNPKRLAISQAILFGMPALSYYIGEEEKGEKWYREHGFMNLPGNAYYYTENLNPVNIFSFLNHYSEAGEFITLHPIASTYDIMPITFGE